MSKSSGISVCMIHALPHRADYTFVLVACVFIFVACAGPVDSTTSPQEETPSQGAIETMARTLAIGSSSKDSPETGNVTATISEITDGGKSGEWSVQVDFPFGTGYGCTADVIEKRSGDLLARDIVNETDTKAHSHVIRFRYKGQAKNLHVRVTESKSGAVLAELVP